MQQAGATVEEIAFDVSDGRDPYQTWRGAWMVGQQFARLAQLEQFGANLKGNVKAGLKVTALDLAKPPSRTRRRCFTASASCSSATTSCSRRRRR